MLMQHDAEECWTQLMYTLKERLEGTSTAGAAPSSSSAPSTSTAAAAEGSEGEAAAAAARRRVLTDLFGIDFVTRLKCAETGEEVRDAQRYLSSMRSIRLACPV
jgi:hypothetical protein